MKKPQSYLVWEGDIDVKFGRDYASDNRSYDF